ncbi:DNA/RNA helicase domain-containing protein [Undibacterium danionis]|uniref:DNA/RNA helicase domain-containing protein n=1 Tax=Undibacterium danionis TaxID=1812100 RepID=A0ABV6IEZ8_9BURK
MALTQHFTHWDVFYSDKLTQIEYAGRDVKFDAVASAKAVASLHLATSMRSFRAEKLSHMVHHLIHNNPEAAAEIYQTFKDKFPIVVTRDLQAAKAWIKQHARANETKGIIASSGAVRLKPEGIFVKNRLSAADWFLNDQDDVRSCHYLEDVATEFDIQGLELDWCLVAWDADYRYVDGKFEHWKFTGTTWKRRQQEEQQRYLENAYRVLLTRARQGMVIFVPLGNQKDLTRSPLFFGDTLEYLVACGVVLAGEIR